MVIPIQVIRTHRRAHETTTTTGTGTYSLDGATVGNITFVAKRGDGLTCTYCCEDGTDWEVGTGTITDATPDTLSRDTIHASSNSNAAVNWGAGTRDIFSTLPIVDGAIYGTAFGEISAVSNSTETAISVAGTAVQVTIFDANGESNFTTPDHTNDHITIIQSGIYFISVSATVNSVSGSASRFEMTVQKNNGASTTGAIHCDRNLAGGSGESGVISMTGAASLVANDTIEVWIENETNTANYVVENISLFLMRIG
jgi:hypothetical protein